MSLLYFQHELRKLAENCNLWRYYGDIDDSYETLANIVRYVAKTQDTFSKLAGVGHWNDPDMVLVL